MIPIVVLSSDFWRVIFRFLGCIACVISCKFLLYSLVMMMVIRSPQAEELAHTLLKQLLLPTIVIALVGYTYLLGSYVKGSFGIRNFVLRFRWRDCFQGSGAGLFLLVVSLAVSLTLGYLRYTGLRLDASIGVSLATGTAQLILWVVMWRSLSLITQDLSGAHLTVTPLLMWTVLIIAFGTRGTWDVVNMGLLSWLHLHHLRMTKRPYFHLCFMAGLVFAGNSFLNIPLWGVGGFGPWIITHNFEVSMFTGGHRGSLAGAWMTLLLFAYLGLSSLLLARRSELE